MARLFITPREINFINDIAKELIKDIAGQKIYYFSISETKTKIHEVYEEAKNKVFDHPIEIECFVNYKPQNISTGEFGTEEIFDIECYIQYKDLHDRGIKIAEGDFFSYGTVFFEVIQSPTTNTLFGQVEYPGYLTITGKQARKRQFSSKIFGPTSIDHTDEDAVQDTFVQQRGQATNRLGKTGDKRDLQENGVLESPLTGPKEVSPKGDPRGVGSSFYDGDR